MPKIRVNNAELYYEDTEKGKETLVFAHGVIWSCRMFDGQVAAFKDRYRCIAYDHRGQGQSEVTADGYDIENVYADGVALIEALGVAPVHFVGLSMGGFVGMRLAARRPDLIKSLILMETSPDAEPAANVPKYRVLNVVARLMGFGLVTGQVMNTLIGRKFMTDPARAEERAKWKKELLKNDRIGITRAVSGVITRKPIYDELSKITCPTLIIVGELDIATVPAKAEKIHQAIKGSQLKIIPGAGHSSSLEEPAAVNAAMEEFLAGLGKR